MSEVSGDGPAVGAAGGTTRPTGPEAHPFWEPPELLAEGSVLRRLADDLALQFVGVFPPRRSAATSPSPTSCWPGRPG